MEQVQGDTAETGPEIPPADDVFSGRLPLAQALEKLRLRLLDLTARNRLLNFRAGAKTLQFVQGDLAQVYERLINSADRRVALHPVPEPKRREFVEHQGHLSRPDVRDYAKQLGISTSYDLSSTKEFSGLRALLYPEDLERHSRRLAREAKTAIEETGANMLFLLIGLLEYPEAPGAGKTLNAPLVAVPVALEKGELERQTGTYRYSLIYTGEELAENLSLREKLKQDFNLELQFFSEEESIETYFASLERTVEGKPGFKLKRHATLAMVSMTKMLLVRDLDPKNWPRIGRGSALTEHEIVQMVFEGKQHEGENRSGEEYDVDHHEHPDIPLVFDADSSQYSALLDVTKQKNLVVEGPPGTGKSQTITNLVANAIASGKKVLFVAEKLAALQVVKSRLTQAGLADFCLELHSNKTSKKDVLESIASRADRRYARPAQLDAMLQALIEKRRTLTTYVELMNSESGNAQAMTIHEVLWKAERYRQTGGDSWRRAQKIKVARANELTRAEFDSLYDQLSRLTQEHERIGHFNGSASFWGFFPRSLPPGAEVEIEEVLKRTLHFSEHFRHCYEQTAEVLNSESLGLSKSEAKALAGSLGSLSSMAAEGMAEELLPLLFSNPKTLGRESLAVLKRLAEHKRRSGELVQSFSPRLKESLVVDEATLTAAENVRTGLARIGLQSTNANQLEALSDHCRALITAAQEALQEFQGLASIVSIPFEHSEQSVTKVAAPIELSANCPTEHLHQRVPELASSGAPQVVLDAKQRCQQIAKARASLEMMFYLDTQISEREVEEALLVMREGDEWWRMFQSRHRAAAAVHRRFARVKKSSRQKRREDLAALHAYLTQSRRVHEDSRYRRAMGSRWNGEATDFDALHRVASWLEKAHHTLLEAQIDAVTFSPLECTHAQVVTLSRAAGKMRQARAALDACTALFAETGPLKDATAARRALASERSWPKRLQFLGAMATRLKEHADALRQWGRSDQAADALIQAAKENHEYQSILATVDKDLQTRRLLDRRYGGIETDLEPVFAAHAYGQAVLQLKLPDSVTNALISDKGAQIRRRLLEHLSQIESAWVPLEEFFDYLGALGRFELTQWAGVSASDPAFADRVGARLQAAKSGLSGLVPWAQYVQAAQFARERGLAEFVDLLESEAMLRGQVPAAFGYRFFGTIAEELFAKHKILGRFSARSHEAIRNEFKSLDSQIISLRGKDVAATAARLARPPAGTSGGRVAEKSELGLLEYLFPQNKPRLPIRQMMIQAGRAVQAYKPCFMMGPQAVAQYLAPGHVEFDIVVMDEASQLKPEEALGAIARGKQLVVVGDPNQLPPTTFFDKFGETQDEDDTKGQAALMQESILDVCMGHFRPVRTLRWHYRSQHESLIAFSNARFYRNNLIVFPSPYARSRSLGVKCRYLADAVYDSQMNVKEANVVVDAVLGHMRNRPEESLGVVTLNLKQRELIDELLDKKMRELRFAEEFCAKHDSEGFGFFVKNLENVQGDERDVIYISTTFGPVAGTRAVYQRFGPISRHDGWRRLNVLFTRARKSLTVFTSMRPEDIVDGDSVPRGTRELRRYLEYLNTGLPADVEDSREEPESDFEIAVMEALSRYGYECTPQLGVAGYRIDLAVKHPNYPNAYMAAIECDGASYHSGRSARDRDRIRQEILERLGWSGRIFRIWSSDWYQNPANETGRLLAWLNGLKSQPMNEAYLETQEPDVDVTSRAAHGADAGSTTPYSVEAPSLESMGVQVDEGDLEVQIGDRVTIVYLGEQREATLTIGTRSDDARGIVDYKTPLAEAVLGLQEGEITILSLPNRPAVRLKVLRIERARQDA